ncbi:MAG: ketose-bisphosphate aldolase [Flavobacteriaceae bacterium]|nr:ketose-bisphosphate aldolase [Flavobacteriaceae bacterium]
MSLVDLKKVLQPAYEGKYAIGAFNVISVDFLEAIIKAAEAKKTPIILNTAEVHMQYLDIELIAAAIKEAANRTKLDVVWHLDHGLSFESVAKAIKSGFSSVMFDGSHLSFEENIRQTKEIVKMSHAAGVTVEAELGAVGGSEEGDLISVASKAMYTNIEQAREFVEETKIDALAVAIGNSHGKYKGDPVLDFELLSDLKDITRIPLVLHGGSGISTEGFHKAIDLGISKINFYTGMSQQALTTLKNELNKEESEGYNDFPEIMTKVKLSVQEIVEEQIEIFRNRK